jgi:alpha-N-acetylglucosamine transferase
MNERTFITICTNTDYIKGVLMLKKSLEKVNTKYPFLCLFPNTFSDENIEIFERNNINFKFIENKFLIDNDVKNYNIKNGSSHWNETFFKLNVFGLVEYTKVVFLDSDMIVIENIDELFEMPHMTSCAAGKLFPRNEDWIHLNSGIMVIEPSVDILDKIKNIFASSTRNFYGDQDVIQALYPEWPSHDKLHLSEHYNLFYGYSDYYSKNYNYNFRMGGY